MQLLKNETNEIYEQLYDNPPTPEDKVRLQTYKIALGQDRVKEARDALETALNHSRNLVAQKGDYQRDKSLDYWHSRLRTLGSEVTRQEHILEEAQKSLAKLEEEKQD